MAFWDFHAVAKCISYRLMTMLVCLDVVLMTSSWSLGRTRTLMHYHAVPWVEYSTSVCFQSRLIKYSCKFSHVYGVHGLVLCLTVLNILYKSVTTLYCYSYSFSYAACQGDDHWPQTAAGCIYAIPCPEDYRGLLLYTCTCGSWLWLLRALINVGNVTRRCGEDGVWQNADDSSCENIAFMNFRNEVCKYIIIVQLVAALWSQP